jgi:hypothetical protein
VQEATALLKDVFEKRLELICTFADPTKNPRATAALGKARFNGTEIELGKPEIIERLGETKLALRWQMSVPITLNNGTSVGNGNAPGWILRRLQDFPLNLQDEIQRTEHTLKRCREQIKAATAEMEKPFQKSAELEAALQEQAEVMCLVSQGNKTVQTPVAAQDVEAASTKPTALEPALTQLSETVQTSEATREPALTEVSTADDEPHHQLYESSVMRELRLLEKQRNPTAAKQAKRPPMPANSASFVPRRVGLSV